MPDLINKAINAKRESKHIEFKECFDPTSPQDWCEIIKDIVAMANSGGGVILFGVDNVGKLFSTNLNAIFCLDPADIADKISKYTGSVDLKFEIREVKKGRQNLVAFVILPVSIPIVFRKPGTYDIGFGKQKSAFSVGTVYFRHGAKSEPGTSEDIRQAIERQLDNIRKSWIKGVRKVVRAPEGSQVVTFLPSRRMSTSLPQTTIMRAVKDPKATPVLLTRDIKKASGVFVHEEVSQGIFDEINNVIDANNALAKGQQQFFLGQPVYYRIYAERHYVQQDEASLSILLHSAVCMFYAPGLYWVLQLPEKLVAKTFAEIYLHPKSPHIHCLLRMAILLGAEFSEWVYERWHKKWQRDPQPPSFYWRFKEMKSRLGKIDSRLIATRTSTIAQLNMDSAGTVSVKELVNKPKQAADFLSEICIKIFEGESKLKSTARSLDYFAYGIEIEKKSQQITRAIIKTIGDREADDLVEVVEEE
jgi:hypothetical protein